MTIKILAFLLFLYVCLIWVLAALRYEGKQIQEFGLWWTAAGIITLIVFIIGARFFGWWRLWRARARSRPAAPAKTVPTTPVHEDDAALAALIAEGNQTLAKAPAFAGKNESDPLFTLPLYLLVGPEGSGKTSAFLNAGLEPQLLAGQAAGTGPVIATRLCNLWLAKNAVFLELSGRLFSGDSVRWRQILRVVLGKRPLPRWRQIWAQISDAPERGWTLRGVIAFSDVKEFGGQSDPQRLERCSRDWQERLRAVGEVFGVDFLVYHVVTKCDAIPFFPEFFRRLPETEANQVFGCTLPLRKADAPDRGEIFAEVEAKRLTSSFRPLYHAIAARRLIHLAHEPDPAQRQSVYEFPRELKRIRSPLVQFLVDVFRPHPLQPGPVLRGYYLTGARDVEVAAGGVRETRADWSEASPEMEATRLFRGDATELFSERMGGGARKQLGRRWLFVSELFHAVILADRPMLKPAVAAPRFDRQRQFVLAGVCAACGLLCFAFFWSWLGNRSLLTAVEAAGQPGPRRPSRPVPLSDLQALEQLRAQVALLSEGGPWSLHWGLYSGNRIWRPAKAAYFRRFQQLLLNDLNGAMVSDLQKVSTNPDVNEPYEPVYRRLYAHLMISSGSCSADPVYLSAVLKEARAEISPAAGPDWQDLADRQIRFYANELPHGNPCRLSEDVAARDHARQYLAKIKGIDGIFRAILANVEKSVAKPQGLADLAPDSPKVLRGPAQPSVAFTPEGWKFVEKASKEPAGLGESCVAGNAAGIGAAWKQDAELEREIQRRFVREYVAQWANFVAGFSVLPYYSADDGARKLEILESYRSPLLALFLLTANQTNFPLAGAESSVLEKIPLVGEAAKQLKKDAVKAADTIMAPQPLSTPADITRSFQPVHWVVPPNAETWVVEKNKPYMESLAALRRSMQEIARTARNYDAAVHQAAKQNYDKALDTARQLAQGFKPLGVEGLDTAVNRLLEEPIRYANPFIKPEGDTSQVNGPLHGLCTQLGPVLRKYPFQSGSQQELTLEELTRFFHPKNGAIWQFHAKSLADLTVKEGPTWKPKDPAKKPQVTQEMLTFLNRAQTIADVFYPGGVAQPQLTYSIRPALDSKFKEQHAVLELDVDGQFHQWSSVLQKQFTWPAAAGAKMGATARIRTDAVALAFELKRGLWGIFRVMADAEPRARGSKTVEWKNSRVGDAIGDPIQPGPVRAEIVEFPGTVDVFHPKFFENFGCPAKAVQ